MRSRESRYATVSSCRRMVTGPPLCASSSSRGSWLWASLTEYVVFAKDLRTRRAGCRQRRPVQRPAGEARPSCTPRFAACSLVLHDAEGRSRGSSSQSSWSDPSWLLTASITAFHFIHPSFTVHPRALHQRPGEEDEATAPGCCLHRPCLVEAARPHGEGSAPVHSFNPARVMTSSIGSRRVGIPRYAVDRWGPLTSRVPSALRRSAPVRSLQIRRPRPASGPSQVIRLGCRRHPPGVMKTAGASSARSRAPDEGSNGEG
jgi:hypothetical protein